jgi:hypothetical protein
VDRWPVLSIACYRYIGTEDVTWRILRSSINGLLRSARLHRAVSRDPNVKLGFLVASPGRRTQSEGGSLEPLVTTHFRNSEVTQELAAPAAALHVGRSDWKLAARVITYITVEWTIDYFAPYKIQEWIACFRSCWRKDGKLLSLYWSEYFARACLATSLIR